MKQKKTNLGKLVHMYSSIKEMERQFDHDVETMGLKFQTLTDKFDMKNPWDQNVLMAILTNILACLTVNARFDGVDLQQAIQEGYQGYIKDYEQMVNKQ